MGDWFGTGFLGYWFVVGFGDIAIELCSYILHNLRQNIVEILNKHNVNIQYPEYKTTPHYQSSTNVDYIDTELKEAYEKLLKNKTIAQYFIP